MHYYFKIQGQNSREAMIHQSWLFSYNDQNFPILYQQDFLGAAVVSIIIM